MSKSMMALLSIVESGKGNRLVKELKNLGIKINFHAIGFGTAPTEMLDFLGLGTNDKDVIFSLGAEEKVRDMIANFGDSFQSHSKYGGLLIILSISAASRVLNEILNFNVAQNSERENANMQNKHHNDLIVISMNEGYSEDVMHVARKAGATGGTVIKGRLADFEAFSEFVTSEAIEERELLFILAPSKISPQIMEAVNSEFGISSEANGIIFSLPTEKAFKI